MALKFLNKKGWHTGSLRNIENVWKAEQKHDAEQKKLEELRKQIHEERERSEFRHLQEQAGLVPRQERLDFLYESGLAVGKGSEGFKALEAPATAAAAASSASADAGSSKAAVPGALFEDKEKPQAANDAWRKLHSDPLLQIRQREQEALARVKNNPVQMAMIRKSVEAKKSKKDDKEKREKKKHKRKHHHKTKSVRNSDPEDTSGSEEDRRKRSRVTSSPQEHSKRKHSSKATGKDVEERRKSDRPTSDRHEDKSSKHGKHSSRVRSDSRYSSESEEDKGKSSHSRNSSRLPNRDEDKSSNRGKHPSGVRSDPRYSSESEEDRRKSSHSRNSSRLPPRLPNRDESRLPNIEEERRKHGDEDHKNKETRARDQQGPAYSRRKGVPKMTEEEREARLREMQMDAELHEEQRWKRINKAAEADALEAARASSSRGKNFLDEAQKSIYGAEKGGSSTIEESVRRRAYYSQGGTAAHESNAFRR